MRGRQEGTPRPTLYNVFLSVQFLGLTIPLTLCWAQFNTFNSLSSDTQPPIVISLPVIYHYGSYPIPFPQWEPHSIGVALSGGGARGVAQIGALEILDSAGIPIRAISGSSIGAFIGCLYAMGWKPQEIITHLKALDWSDIFLDKPAHRSLPFSRRQEGGGYTFSVRLSPELTPIVPGAISPGQKLYHNLLSLTLRLPYRHINDWTKLPIKANIVTLDMNRGERVVLQNGDPALAIRGSMAMPLLFDALPYNDWLLVDGGLAENIPVQAVRQLGVDKVIAIDVTSPLREYSPPWQPWQVVDQVTTILIREPTDRSRNYADLSIRIETPASFTMPPIEIDSLIEAGRMAARQALPNIISWLEPQPEPDDTAPLPITSIFFSTSPYTENEPYFASSLRGDTSDTFLDTFSLPEEWSGKNCLKRRDIQDFLRELYRSGKVFSAQAVWHPSTRQLHIKAVLTPYINQVQIASLPPYLPKEIFSPFWELTGEHFHYPRFQESVRKVLSNLREVGYPVAHFSEVSLDPLNGVLKFNLDLGYLHSIDLQGIVKKSERERGRDTRRGFYKELQAEIPLHIGEPIDQQKIMQSAANLYGLEMFRWVYPQLAPDDQYPLGWKLTYHLQEQPGLLLRFKMNYLTEQGAHLQTVVVHPSFYDRLSRHQLSFSWGTKTQSHSLSLIRDRLLGLPIVHQMELFYLYRKRQLYQFSEGVPYNELDRFKEIGEAQDQSWGGRISIGGEARRWGLGRLALRWEDHWFDKQFSSQLSSERKEYSLLGIGGEITLDTRDRDPFPLNGLGWKISLFRAMGLTPKYLVFSKGEGLLENYFTPFHRHTFSIRAHIAYHSPTTPYDEISPLGGLITFPGAHYEQIRKRFRLGGGAEYRYDLISRLLADSYIGVRGDFIMPQDSPPNALSSIKRDKVWSATSLYLAYDTLWGPMLVMWSYSFPVHKYRGQSFWWLQLGYIIK